MTISQFAKRLLDDERLNYDGLRLPRLPAKIQKFVNEQIGKANINADNLRREEMIKKKEEEEMQEKARLEKIK